MNVVEKTGKTVEEAVATALAELGVDRQDVDVEILEEARRGILGIGSRDAKVRLTVRGEVSAEAAPAKTEPASEPETAAERRKKHRRKRPHRKLRIQKQSARP